MTTNDSSGKKSSIMSSSAVSVHDRGNDIFAIRIADTAGGNTLSSELVRQLVQAIDLLQQSLSLKVLVLEGSTDTFLKGEREHCNEALEQNLYRSLAAFPYPVIAAMRGDALGAGFLVGTLCDIMVCSDEATYGFTQSTTGLFPTAEEAELFRTRFGRLYARDFLYHATQSTGSELREKGWTCAVLQGEQVEPHSHSLASKLARKSRDSLRLLKQHLARDMHRLAHCLNPVEPLKCPEITLCGNDGILAADKHFELNTSAENVLLIRIRYDKNECNANAMLTALRTLLAQVADAVANNALACRAIVLTGECADFLPLPEGDLAEHAVADIQAILHQSPLPLIAVLNPDASAKAWLLAQLCDAVVYPRDGNYSATGLLQDPSWSILAGRVFADHFGEQVAREMMMAGVVYSGTALATQIGPVLVANQGESIAVARELAQRWAKWPLETVTAWRTHGVAYAFDAPSWLQPETQERQEDTPVNMPLQSKVLTVTAHPGGILLVKMEDRASKNLFSPELVSALNEVFQQIDQTPAYKVVVLFGYGNYFASGGTREALEAIQEGRAKFTDQQTYLLPLNCKIPVIAAMQGHGVGGGLSLGLFADFVLLAKESKYLSPYMGYGFTPGGGATLIVPCKLGRDLGIETLFTAEEYDGSELGERGLRLPVHRRQDLLDEAMTLAQQVARLSRTSLIALKQIFNQAIHERLHENTQEEIAMHGKTFVGHAGALSQIQENFNPLDNIAMTQAAKPDDLPIAAAGTIAHPQQVATPTSNHHSLADIASSLGQMLAQELHMQAADIEEDMPFIDLGLDSITGVTWMRKINERYHTSIQATKVYSHPTLTQLAGLVMEEIAKLGGVADQSACQLPDIRVAEELAEPVVAKAATSGRQPDIAASLGQMLAQELHMQAGDIEEDMPFIDLGLDSITGVTWMRKINERYHTSIQATKVYSHPTLTQLAGLVMEEIDKLGKTGGDATLAESVMAMATVPDIIEVDAQPAGAQPQTRTIAPLASKSRNKLVSWRDHSSRRTGSASSSSSSSSSGQATHAIAVIGMAGQFPKAKTLEQYWDNIAQGRNCISEVPKQRWDMDDFYQEGDPAPGKTNSKWMGCLEDYDLFDPLFFDISPREAMSMDPQQRVFLQSCWHAIEHAGYNPRSLSGSKCGVFVGCGPGDYHLLSRELQISALGFTGSDTAILAARVSYFLNLQGPCLAIETACSSSLVAIASACDSLVSGGSDIALAGGVGVISSPELFIKMAQTGMLSQDGQCFTFDQRANGFAPGEGVGTVMLKRLADAERDQDIIVGVIRGWGVNQDGKTNGITAPNPDSQARLEQEVYDRFGIDPADIQMIEAHGTGTKLGDPIEVDALRQSFSKYTKKKGYCALTSVKSNIGHCFTAAGVASVIKTLLALQHKQLPPTVNFSRLNEHIDLQDSPFYVNDRLQDWKLNGAEQRQAAVSGFGFGGTNAHLVISEYVAPIHRSPRLSVLTEQGKFIVPLSARTADQMRRKMADLLDFISVRSRSIDLVSLAYTLQVGRDAMDERLGFMVGSIDELAEKLRTCLSDETYTGHGIYHGRASDSKEAMSLLRRDADIRETIVTKLVSQQNLSKLLELWVKGLAFDWNLLYDKGEPQRMRLPVYPFARERYWIDRAPSMPPVGMSTAVAAAAALHPLLHRNTSDLRQIRFESAFRGDESFLADWQTNGVKILPAFACLEMVRAALLLATSTPAGTAAVELRDLTWGQPFVAAKDKELTIALYANTNDHIDFEIYSKNHDDEVVHCQGSGVVHPGFCADQGKIVRLRDGLASEAKQSLEVQTSLQASSKHAGGEFLPIPGLLEGVLQACAGSTPELAGLACQPLWPSCLEHAFMAPDCPQNASAWVAYSAQGKGVDRCTVLDIELDDQHGNVCIQIRGLALREALLAAPIQVLEPHPVNRQDALPPVATVTQAQLQQELKESLADALYMSAADIRMDKPFIELGLDSIVGVEWINKINKQYQVKLTATKIYDYPTIAELAACLHGEIGKTATPAPLSAPPAAVGALPQVHRNEPEIMATRVETEMLVTQAQLQQELKDSLADALYMSAADIRVDKPFIELGLDSIVGVEWINKINKQYQVKLTATKIYDYPTIAELAASLREELAKNFKPATRPVDAVPPLSATSATPSANRSPSLAPMLQPIYPVIKRYVHARPPATNGSMPGDTRIAVIGMSGKYPQAKNLDQFWENLAQSKNAITEIPPSRWDVNRYYDPDPKKEGRLSCKWIGMLDDIEYFDPLFFRISPAEAENMDPQHRLFLEEGYKAFEHAGYSGKALSNTRCGVYVGIIGTEYAALVPDSAEITGNNPAIGAARIAYFLNLKGPAIAVDTACSASLVAIHLACQGLLNKETDMALAGGASVYLNPETYLGMSRAGMLSPDGQCKTFDNGANGFVPGEGAGAVVLKRLEDAERDHDVIYGVILASALNQDGKTNGITAPSVNSQIELERELYARHGIDPETISYVETHGTGTRLGDPIELEALATVFREKTAKKNFCGLGSVKSNIGHASGAAGVASLQKVLLCMQHRMLVPTLNVVHENTLFDFADSPFYVVKQARAWAAAAGKRRRAAVSAFGFSGTNAHLVVEEYMPGTQKLAAANRVPDAGVMMVLSARTADQLQQRVRDLLSYLRKEGRSQADLMAIAYTLLEGRDVMDERLAIVVHSVDELAAKLEAWLGNEHPVDKCCHGRVERGEDGLILISQQDGIDDMVRQCLVRMDLGSLIEFWVKGLDLQWATLYSGPRPQRVALPTYPFAKKRCWVNSTNRTETAAAQPSSTVMHPLVHRNISVLDQQRFTSVFSGQESFLVGHGGNKVLPAAGFLEMARFAVHSAVPEERSAPRLVLHDVAWGRPLQAAQDQHAHIVLFKEGDGRVNFEIYTQLQGRGGQDEETVHCQGHAVYSSARDPEQLDLDMIKRQMALQTASAGDLLRPEIKSLYRGERQLLAELRLPAHVIAGRNDYVLHPILVDKVLHVASDLLMESLHHAVHSSLPFAIGTIEIDSACTADMTAWVRYAQSGPEDDKALRLDIDLCDTAGKICVRMRGVAWDTVMVNAAPALAAIPTSSSEQKQVPSGASNRGVVRLPDPQSATFAAIVPEKPRHIVLQ